MGFFAGLSKHQNRETKNVKRGELASANAKIKKVLKPKLV
jgi:hypothetical protein